MVKRIIFVSNGAVKTRAGYVAFAWSEGGLYANSFFHPTKAAALSELKKPLDLTPFEVEQANFEKESDAPGWIGDFFTAFADGDYRACAKLLKTKAKFDFGSAPAHRQAVWRKLLAIPWGKTRTYGEIAGEIGSAARAVGGACGANRCPIIIPCHRVIGADGKLCGFGGGLDLKAKLLAHESAI